MIDELGKMWKEMVVCSICLEGLWKIVGNCSQNIWPLGQESNLRLVEYESGLPTTQV